MKLTLFEKMLIANPIRDYFLRTREVPKLLGTMPVVENGTYFEMGCGRGSGSLSAIQYLKPGILVSLDIDEDMLVRARKMVMKPPVWASDTDTSHIHFVLSESGQLPFPDETFDAGFHLFVFDHLPNWRHVIEEIYRVMKWGGIYAFEDYFIPDSIFLLNRIFHHVPIQRNDLLQAFLDAGFIFDDLKCKTSTRHCFMRVRK